MANFHLSRAMMDDGEYEYIQKKVEDGVWARWYVVRVQRRAG